MSRTEQPFCSTTGTGLLLSLHVQPRASKNEICGLLHDALKIRLTSPPVEGAANKLCREFLADLLQVPRSAVEIVAGETSRHKRVHIACADPERLRRQVDDLVRHHTTTD